MKSSFYSAEVDHDKLISSYEENFGKLALDSPLLDLYQQIQKLKPGNPAPDIGLLENRNGEMMNLEDLKGQNILLTVWGSWCPYCREEIPHIKKLEEKFGQNFTSVGISLDDDKEKWKAAIDESAWKGLHLIDPESKSTFQSNYLIGGTNVHFLIDKAGLILSSNEHKPSSPALEKLIKELE